ncbi:hypothetical protein JMJ77_0006019, partial [Colletotrichum scovillei]
MLQPGPVGRGRRVPPRSPAGDQYNPTSPSRHWVFIPTSSPKTGHWQVGPCEWPVFRFLSSIVLF